MQFGQRHRQVLGVAICAVAIGVASTVPQGDDATPTPALQDIAAVIETSPGAQTGGSIAATVSWPRGAAEPSDICVVVFDDDGGVAGDLVTVLEPILGQSEAGRWTAEGVDPGRYTVYVAQCVTPDAEARAMVEPQFLGGGATAEAARWIEVTTGDQVDIGTVALHRSGSVAWQAG